MQLFSFVMFLEAQVLKTPTKSSAIKAQSSNTMQFFDYNPLAEACSYITRAITRERCMLLKTSGNVNINDDPVKWPDVIRKAAHQEFKRSLSEGNGAGKIIIIVFDDNEVQKNAIKLALRRKSLSQTWKKAQKSEEATKDSTLLKDATKESNGTRDESPHHNLEL